MLKQLFAAALCSCMFGAAAQEAGKFAWQDIGQRLQASQSVSPLGPNFAGDQVGLSNGALSFTATDVSVPGNSALPVAFSRSYVVKNRKDYYSEDMLADWSVDVPNISGIFTTDWNAPGAEPGNRCSDTRLPTLPGGGYLYSDYWIGLTLDLPGGGGDLLAARSDITKPTTGGPYPWVTGDGTTHLACLNSLQNASGQGFIATTADGTRYWFDRMAQYREPDLKGNQLDLFAGHEPIYSWQPRRKNMLLVTRVEDRFGNRVDYTYTNPWNQPAKLIQIAASDGRQIDITYSGAYITSVSDGTRTWLYGYVDTGSGRKSLNRVTLPDNSAWNIQFTAFTDAEIKYNESPNGELIRTCTTVETPLNHDDEPAGTITHPSGGVARFTVNIREHGRSSVPVSCGHVTTWTGSTPGTGNDKNDDVNLWAISANSFTLKQKQVSGVGLTTAAWNYSYAPGISTYPYPGTTPQYPVCDWANYNCNVPPCTVEACAGSSKTTVTGPNGDWTRYAYGNTYRYNEGKLLQVDSGNSTGETLRTVTHTYDLSRVDQAYPALYGYSRRVQFDGFPGEYHRPLLTATTTQQGLTFTLSNLTFNDFAQPLSARRFNSLGDTKSDTTDYNNDLVNWVIGQIKRQLTNGIETAKTDFDSRAQPWKTYAYTQLQQTLTYYADGTVATVKDARNFVTTLSNWYRGIPRTIKHPATAESATGAIESATVNGSGWITSVTDENGFVTGYGYDVMGRLASVVYPSGDSTVWNPTTLTFTGGHPAAYGLPTGHWRQSVSTGNARTVTYFDAMWRPVVKETFDNTNSTNVLPTLSQTVTRYDLAGRVSFVSYPQRSLTAAVTSTWANPAVTANALGTDTFYDALDRVTSTVQDSELGPLTTTTKYLTGFQTQITNPRGKVTTTTRYLAYDQPSTDWPLAIIHPEGANTDIARDDFGKPTSIARRNAANTLKALRSFSYNTFQQLCKRSEPETGATLMGYDPAGNLAWSASGLAANTACDATGTTAAVVARKASRTFDARGRVVTLRFPDGGGDQDWTYTADGLPDVVTTYNGANATLPVINAYSYNKRRMLDGQGESLEQPGWYTWGLGYGYDANANLALHTYPTGLTVRYAPNALGQAGAVTGQVGSGAIANYATGVGYFANGAITGFTYGNGIVHSLLQNTRGLPDRSKDAYGSTAFLDDGYDYDANANVAAITDAATGRATRGNRTMVYDGLDRLTSTASTMYGTTGAVYTYDVLDNLKTLKAPGRDHTYVYDAITNRLNTVSNTLGGTSAISLTYDVQGNLAAKNAQTYNFDIGNRLRSATGLEAYRYDGLGRRVLAWSAQGLGNILSQYSQSGQLMVQTNVRTGKQTDHIHLVGSLIAQREVAIGGTVATVKYQHTDALGSPVAVTNSARTVIERSEYEPYGKTLSGGPGVTAPKDGPGYTGHVFDTATGLNYMQQRYYDPGIGRFLSVDPVTADGGDLRHFNRYAYAYNNPYKFTDPDGRCPACDRFGDSYRDMSSQDRDGLAKGAAIASAAIAIEVATTKGLGLIAKGIAAIRAIRAADGAGKTITRYMGSSEAAIAKSKGAIPNVGPDRIARPTHVTADKPLESGAQAMKKYELPEAPTHSATVSADRVSDLGKAPDGRWTTSGNGGQNATSQPIPVKPEEIKRLQH